VTARRVVAVLGVIGVVVHGFMQPRVDVVVLRYVFRMHGARNLENGLLSVASAMAVSPSSPLSSLAVVGT
jgi:hypothetical protein